MAKATTEQNEAQVAKELVADILKGDINAEKTMILRYQRGVHFMLRHRSQNPSLADDLSQETWRLVIEKVRAGELKQPEKLAAFIVQIAKNQLLMHYRKQKLNSDTDIDQLAASETQPQQLIEQHNMAVLVRKLVNEMNTKRDKELMLRFYLQEQDKELICQELNLSLVHFNRVLFRARQRFKQLWQQYSSKDIDSQ